MAQARIYSDVNERMRAFRKRKRNAVDPNVTPPSVTLSPKRNAPKHNAAEPSVTPDGMSPGARRGRIGRAHDKQIAQLIADELRAMGASSSEPKALKNAVDRVKPGLSVLDQTRSDEAFFKVYYRHWPRLQIDGWTVRLQQHFQKSANGVHELINALLSVAGPSGGQDYIDGLITRAMGADRSNRSKPQNWQWLWSEVDKMKQRPGHRWWIRRDLAGSSSFEAAVEAALGDRPQHFRKIAKTTGLDTIQVRNRLAVLHRRERAFPHGNGLWARTKRDTPQSSLSDKIWMALDGGREANYIELADELHERQTSICSCLSRMKDGVKGKKVVKTPDGKYKRSALG